MIRSARQMSQKTTLIYQFEVFRLFRTTTVEKLDGKGKVPGTLPDTFPDTLPGTFYINRTWHLPKIEALFVACVEVSEEDYAF